MSKAGRRVGPGVVGESVVRGSHVMAGLLPAEVCSRPKRPYRTPVSPGLFPSTVSGQAQGTATRVHFLAWKICSHPAKSAPVVTSTRWLSPDWSANAGRVHGWARTIQWLLLASCYFNWHTICLWRTSLAVQSQTSAR